MYERDLFIGLVANVLGGLLIVAALRNDPRCFEMRTPMMIAQLWGRTAARLILSLVGIMMVAVGCYLWFGRETVSPGQPLSPRQPTTSNYPTAQPAGISTPN